MLENVQHNFQKFNFTYLNCLFKAGAAVSKVKNYISMQNIWFWFIFIFFGLLDKDMKVQR